MSSPCPLMATWLLDRCCDEGLVGDLVEQYAKRRSRVWYVRESIIALSASCVRTMLDHKWLAVRAILTGWVVWNLSNMVFERTLADWELVPASSTEQSVWLSYSAIAMTLLKGSGWFVNGWLIGRLHRPYQAAMVLTYVVFSLVMCIPALINVLAEVGHPHYTPTPFGMLIAVTGLLLGGIVSTSPRSSHEAVALQS